MDFSPGVCPNCSEFILQKNGVPFLVCPLCSENISAREGAALLDATCINPRRTTETIAKCLSIEQTYGAELPLKVLIALSAYYPQNEEIAYLIVKMSDYSPLNVKEYLTAFAFVKKPVPFAVDFLENSLNYKTLGLKNLFEEYIENKLSGEKRKKWLAKLAEMKTSYVGRASSSSAIAFLYVYYVVCTVINVTLAALFLFAGFEFLICVLFIVAAFFVEIGVLFLHNKKFGNRLDMSDRERLFVVIFMSSIVVTVGCFFIGVIK